MPRSLAVAAALLAAFSASASPDETPGAVTSQAVPGGTVLADNSGHTLYTYDGDAAAKSACAADCARDWHPLPAPWAAGPAGDWTILVRADGARQWAWKGKPLYTFTGDLRRGDITGDGAQGKFHAVMTERKFLPPGVAIWRSDVGPAFAAADGKTLYVLAELYFNPLGTQRHTGRNLGLAECNDADCAKTWRPFAAPADAAPGGDWSIVVRADGTRQWAYKAWPVFTYAPDAAPGDALGEGVTEVRNGLSGLSWQIATL